MPGNCGAEATDWFLEESYFSIAAASTEKLVETRTCLCLSCHTFGFCNERPGCRVDSLGLRALILSSAWETKKERKHSIAPRCKQFPSISTSVAKTTLILTRSCGQFFVFQPVSN